MMAITATIHGTFTGVVEMVKPKGSQSLFVATIAVARVDAVAELANDAWLGRRQALVDFENFAGYPVGAQLQLMGQIEPLAVVPRGLLAQSQQARAKADARVLGAVRGWANRVTKDTQKRQALEALTKHFMNADDDEAAWLADVQAVMYGNGHPSAKFAQLQAKLKPLLDTRWQVYRSTRQEVLYVREVDSIRTVATTIAATPGVIRAVYGVGEKDEALWAQLQAQTRAYNQAQA